MTNFRAVLLLSTLLIALTGQAQRYEFSRPLMGMAFQIIVHSEDEAKAKRAAKAAFDRVAVLNQIMSDYEPNSELNNCLTWLVAVKRFRSVRSCSACSTALRHWQC